MKRNAPCNTDDVIDSRDIIARIEELEDERESLVSDAEEERGDTDEEVNAGLEARAALVEWDASDDAAELKALKALAEEASGYSSDWPHGETLIRRTYWVDYVEELCKDIGDLPKDIPHYIEIDWKRTADNIEADYTTVDFDGTEYLIRSC